MIDRRTGQVEKVTAQCPVCGMVNTVEIEYNHGQRRCEGCEHILHATGEIEVYYE